MKIGFYGCILMDLMEVDYLYKLRTHGLQIGARKRTVLIPGGHKVDERRCDVSIARALDLHDQNYTLTREQCKSFSTVHLLYRK